MSPRAMDPEEILADLLTHDPELRRESYYGERSVFYNPGGAAALGSIYASVKDYDGPNDRMANLSRPGVFRLAFGLTRETFEREVGPVPGRPPKGELLRHPGWDLTELNVLLPHPVYAWMSWVQVLAPTPATYESLRPLLAEALDVSRAKWRRRAA